MALRLLLIALLLSGCTVGASQDHLWSWVENWHGVPLDLENEVDVDIKTVGYWQTQYECAGRDMFIAALQQPVFGCAQLDCSDTKNTDMLCSCHGWVVTDFFRRYELPHCQGFTDWNPNSEDNFKNLKPEDV